MGVERLDRAQRQQRAEPEGDVRRAPDFGADGIDRERQALAAERFRPRHRVPAGRGPALIRIGPAGGGGDLAVVELDAVLVADPVERRQHVGGEFSGFLQHGGGDVAVEIAVMAGLHGGLQARAVIEGQQHVVDRRAVGHGGVSGLSGRERRAAVFPRNPRLSQLPGGEIEPGRERRDDRDLDRNSPGSPADYSISRAKRAGAGSAGNSADRRLKWLNSLYRPAVPEECPASTVSPHSRPAVGASPSGKAGDFDSPMRRFESLPPQPGIARFREYPSLDEKGPPNAGFSHRQKSPETDVRTFWAENSQKTPAE